MFAALLRQQTLVTVIALIFLLLGIAATLRIPVQMIPDIETRTITVETRWAGATPQDIEKEILIEQEQYLRNVPNLTRMTAIAESGSAEIELEFPFSVDMTAALIQVNNALSQVSPYPTNVDQPRIVSAAFSTDAFLRFHVGTLPGNPKALDIQLMNDFIDDRVRPRMESVKGVSEVGVNGGAQRQLQILLDPGALAQRGISLTELRDAITQRNRDISGGELEAGKRRYLIRTLGRFDDAEDLAQLVIARQGDSIVRLADVAEVRQGQSRLSQLSFYNGQPGIGMDLRRESGANVIDIKYAIEEEMAAINDSILRPAGMEMVLTADDVRYVEASVSNVWSNLLLGAAFATLVMYLFLRSARITFIGVIGIPFCTIAAFLGLMLTGRTINVISMAGIAFAIGMSVDNSIVVLENIERYRRLGLDRIESALRGVQEVWPATLASTATTILVFLPIVFIEEEAGQLYSDVAIAVSAAIFASMLVAVTLVPSLCSRFSFSMRNQHENSPAASPASWAGKRLERLIATPFRRGAILVTTLAISGWTLLVLTPPAEYLPEGEEPKTFAVMSPPPGYSLQEMAGIAAQVEDYFLPHVGADPAAFLAGDTEVPPLAYMNMRVAPTRLFIVAEAADPGDIEALMDALTSYYERFPGMRAFASKGSIISSNDGGTRSINLDISGPDLATVYEAANNLYREARQEFGNPRIQSQPSSLSLDQPLIQIRPDWAQASALGLAAGDVGFSVAALTEGAYVDDFFLDDEKIDIYLYGPQRSLPLDQLPNLLLHTPSGATLPLSAVASIDETMDTSVIRRVDGSRTVTLNVIPPPSIALEAGVEQAERMLERLRHEGVLSSAVAISISGASDQLNATRDALMGNFLIAIVIVYLLLVAIFSHWGYPLLILTSIPLGVVGGIIGLAAMNTVGSLLPLIGIAPLTQPFDMITMLGFLILMGTVVNNPILVVDQARRRLHDKQLSVQEAVSQAVQTRLRPIAITTLTTLCGLSPLVFLPGEGTELYRGVGAIVLFGLLGASIVTVTFLPALMISVLQLSKRNTQPAQAQHS
ncbi:efflux RND transporter permease subunit [Vreelandella venusta]|uniref:Efflux RND transporter permease subunit n=1 Tax=Vreelandella venusta TaxID=44935 RepID=A0AAP9ZEJ7_9GAMM|nr:efflux RND transporter permease subunit [Halomonas venusta]QRL02445.1 efflux RND transporter permease subunit [Halomonas venusta]GEK49462.1 acriflavine resistance protein B [Halomonas venusta]